MNTMKIMNIVKTTSFKGGEWPPHFRTLRVLASALVFGLSSVIALHAGTNASVMFNTNTGALVVPSATVFYGNNPPPVAAGGLTNFNAATVTLSSNLVISNNLSVNGNENILGTLTTGSGANINGLLTTGSDISAGGNVALIGNINAAGNINAVGNVISGTGFFGSGALLTGIPDSALVVPPVTNHFSGNFSATTLTGSLNASNLTGTVPGNALPSAITLTSLTASNLAADHLLGATNGFGGGVVNSSLPAGSLTFLPGMHNSDLVCFVEINSAADGFSDWQPAGSPGAYSALFTNYYSKPFSAVPGAVITDINGNFSNDAWVNNGGGAPPTLVYFASLSTTNYGVFACYSKVPVATAPWDFQITIIGVQ
jgi:hypothetical protein